MKSFSFGLSLGLVCISTVAMAQDDKNLGTRKAPIKLAMVPSSDATKILSNMEPVARCLEQKTGYFFEISVPNAYIVVIEGLGAKRTDVAFLNTAGYIIAHKRFGTEALLKVSREGETTYKAQIITKADGKINKLEDLNGKKFAFVEPASTSGYILPQKLFLDSKVKLGETVFAGKHDSVVTMVYQGQVDAGATFYSLPTKDGKIGDARKTVLTQFPDVEKKIKILTLTEAIPNDPIVVRKEISAEMKSKIKDGFIACVKVHPDAFRGINNSDGVAPVTDEEYDGVRKTVDALGIDLGGAVAPKKK